MKICINAGIIKTNVRRRTFSLSEVYILEVHKTPDRYKKPFGRRYEQRGPYWRYVGGERDTARREKRLSRKGYRTIRYTDDFKRGASYRSAFFNNTAPDLFGRYQCAYCGRKLPYAKVTVDHIIPVGAAKRSEKLRKKLHGKSVNDPSNLVASCKRCNQKKGMETGRWILKARLGRHPLYHFIKKLLILETVLLLVYLLYRFLPELFPALRPVFRAAEDTVRAFFRPAIDRIRAFFHGI